MSMSYDSALITGAQIVEHTGVTDLASLATDSELVLDTFALHAHRAIYRRLEGNGIDPTLLTNEDRLKDAVAFEACKRLALAGHLNRNPADFSAEVDATIASFRPVYASADSPRNAGEGIPVVGHLDSGPTFSGDLGFDLPGYFSDGTPSSY